MRNSNNISFFTNIIITNFFLKESGLKIDFVISYNGYATLIEVKTKTGNTKSSKTVMKHPEHYGKTKLIKIGENLFLSHFLLKNKKVLFLLYSKNQKLMLQNPLFF